MDYGDQPAAAAMCLRALGGIVSRSIQHFVTMFHLAAVADEEMLNSLVVVRTLVPEVRVSLLLEGLADDVLEVQV